MKDMKFVNDVLSTRDISEWFPCIICLFKAFSMYQVFETVFFQVEINKIIYFIKFFMIFGDINQVGLDNRPIRLLFFIKFDTRDIHNIMDFHSSSKSKFNHIGAYEFQNREET